MMKKEIQIIALSTSESSPGNFVLVMEEIASKLRLPIIIGTLESQAIAVYLERMSLPRPMTHDLFNYTLAALKAEIVEVLIHDIVDGVFHAWMILKDNVGNELKIDARPSDAIAMAIRNDCPIYVYDFVLDEAGIAESERKLNLIKGSLAAYSITELEELLVDILAKEDYESAARIRDMIERRRK
jgi:uncharacterized protein